MKFEIDSTPLYDLSPYLFMQFAEPLGCADSSIDAAWDFKNNCWQEKVIEILKELSPTMIRWGGCFASYYHWREGVGPKRVPMHNICWDGIYLNQVGTAELAQLTRIIDAQLLLNVNFMSEGQKKWMEPVPGDDRRGTAEEAAAWVRYCNDPEDKLRLSHGVKEPYNVRFWQIGNETGYQPPSFTEPGFTAEENGTYAARFVREMRKADPSIRLIVWGDGPNQVWKERFRNGKLSDWTQGWGRGLNSSHSTTISAAMKNFRPSAVRGTAKILLSPGNFSEVPQKTSMTVLNTCTAALDLTAKNLP